jgi:hypothetical protein
MTPETQARLERVRKSSSSLSTVFNVLAAITAIAGIAGVALIVFSRSDDATFSVGYVLFRGQDVTGLVRILAGIGLVLTVSLILKLLHHLSALFGCYARGEIFTSATVHQFRQVGISLFLLIAVWLYRLISSVILTAVNAQPTLAEVADNDIGLDVSNPLGPALIGIMIIVISWVMDVGRELREEQDLTV